VIINISGTSGTGKSTLVRQVMKTYDTCEPFMIEGRKRPMGYTCESKGIPNKLFIPGHYETACGGCDTLSMFPNFMDFLYDMIRNAHTHRLYPEGKHVMFEGLLVESDVRRAVETHNLGHEMKVIHLDVTLEECFRSIAERRARKGKLEPVARKHTEDRYRSVKRRQIRLSAAGIDAAFYSRENAYETCRKVLGLQNSASVPAAQAFV